MRAHLISLSLVLGLTVSLVWGQAPTHFTLRGVTVTGLLPITIVGRGTDASPSLFCHTTNLNTVWLFPNGSMITQVTANDAASNSFIFLRVPTSNYVLLRRGHSVRSPGGDYCCGSATNVNERLCINLVVVCKIPPSISNGSPGTPTNTTFGGTVTYTCDNGYEMSSGVTMATASCLATRNWETVPTCLVVDCGPPPSISSGSPGTPTKTTFEGNVTYICNNGYQISPGVTMATTSCLATGNWENVPICLDHTLVQLRFAPTDHCIQWNEKRASQISLYMRNSIQEAILTEGNLTIPLDHIEEGYFSCHTHHDRTIFRTRVIGTQSASAVEVGTYIQKWVESGPAVRVDWYIVFIDKSCPVSISSMTEPECGQHVNFQRCVDICVARG